MRKNLILGAVAGAALVMSSGSLALAAGGSGGSHGAQGGAAADSAATAVAPVVFACDGGAQKQVKNRIVSSPFTFSEAAAGVDTYIPGAGLAISGPARGTDTLVVTVSGETRLTGSTGSQDWIGLEVKVDGVNIKPFTAAGDVMAFSGSPTWNLHSATFCAKVGPGTHSVRAFTNLADFETDDTLSGWIDDYTLSVERSE